MINKNKGCYLHIRQDATAGKKDFIIEVGGDFDCFRIAVDYADLVTIKNEILKIEERAKNENW